MESFLTSTLFLTVAGFTALSWIAQRVMSVCDQHKDQMMGTKPKRYPCAWCGRSARDGNFAYNPITGVTAAVHMGACTAKLIEANEKARALKEKR